MSETNRIEYKQELTESLEKEVIAFLNYKEGGVLYIGINKDGVTIGVVDSDTDQLKIKDRLKHNIAPSCMGLFDVVTEQKGNLTIIKIIVASGSEKPYFLKKYGMTEKGSFVRVGTASEPMPQKMIDTLFAKRTRNSIGKIKSNHQELSFEQLKIYYDAIGKRLNNKFATNLELLNADENFNYVAYLLSDKNGTSIKFAKYKGKNRVNLIENNEYGYESLIKATKLVLDKMELENKTITQITAKERKETRYWDAIALREALINAFVHNDYTAEVPPKFELFDDRIEITSTGGLPDGLSQEEFFAGFSVPRNKEIIRIYKDLDLVEQLGSGIPRILESYSKDSFKFSDNFLRMSFPINDLVNDQANDQANDLVNDQASIDEISPEQIKILRFAYSPKSNKEIQEVGLSLKKHSDNFKRYIEPLLVIDALKRILPDVPNAPRQKYYTSEKGKLILSDRVNDQANDLVNDQASIDEIGPEQIKILMFADRPKSNTEIQEVGLNLKKHSDNFKRYIEPLLAIDALKRTLPDVPNSPLQKYYTSEKGKKMIKDIFS